MAIIESEQRVRCNYRVISVEDVRKFQNSNEIMKKKSTKIKTALSNGKK